ncbi:MAG: GNAT family N-acetyltransferase [Alphaproteobacteria bacterium]|nr:GNAT family N-acetyltransferase [Alphaproteobacteria bacterium]
MAPIEIRAATRDDAATIARMIQGHAAYDGANAHCHATEADILRHGFGDRPAFEALLAVLAGEAVGLALFFGNFSTWEGKPGLFVEDLFVTERARGYGVGSRLMAAIAKLAIARGCARVDWQVMQDAGRARAFYQQLGARPIEKWLTYRLTGTALEALAADG